MRKLPQPPLCANGFCVEFSVWSDVRGKLSSRLEHTEATELELRAEVTITVGTFIVGVAPLMGGSDGGLRTFRGLAGWSG